MSASQVLTADQMRAAEQRIFDVGTSVGELMEIAAGGAAQWVRRLAAGRKVTVLCGPGNNGGDGYVIARRLREWGLHVQVVAPAPPKTDAAKDARAAWSEVVLTSGGKSDGEVFIDCLFGSGLTRPLDAEHALLLRDLAERHAICIAIDVPSGIAADTGAALNEKLPRFDVTLALGAWKYAHCLSAARAYCGTQRLVEIGIEPVEGAAFQIERPRLKPPAYGAHKYTRGLCGIVAGELPGAAILAALAAQRAGAGYVRLYSEPELTSAPPSLPVSRRAAESYLDDARIGSLLVGPGLGTGPQAIETLKRAFEESIPAVFDADALRLIGAIAHHRAAPTLLTPHDGELDALCRAYAVVADGRRASAQAVAAASGFVVLAKGPDSFVAAPDGRLAIAPPATSWLSTAGTGDVLAGIAASRMATGCDPFEAACEAVWLHGEAARLAGPAFSADELAYEVSNALAACL
ncbi:MAG: NAD(P)H-hydrate dehydratase [Pseudomonadota bacterium]